MINEVRNTVMAILSKDNNGYITPEEFNLFAKQAQLEVFEDYFFRYVDGVVKQNNRAYNSGYADKLKQTAEVIDSFSANASLTLDAGSSFKLPSDYYSINVVYYNGKEVEPITQYKSLNLLASNLTAPTTAYPAYVKRDRAADGSDLITVYPTTITAGVSAFYVRYPLDPKWTYTQIGGNPLFNQSAVDYQDFELPLSDANDLILRILQYAGVNIREYEVTQFAKQEEMMNKQQGE
jgi:hypothetical protein